MMSASAFFGLSLSALGACAAVALVLMLLLRTGLAWRLATDTPNARSLHVRPTPRVGGVGVTPVCAVAMLLLTPSLWIVAVAALLLGLLSLADDRWGLPARWRFAAHLAGAVAIVVAAPPGTAWWLAVPIAFGLVWVVNLYNFMDGADGLAGGMALIGFGGYAVAAAPHAPELALASAVVAGAAGGFLLFNFPPARIFLGDGGSVPLGLLAGALGYVGWREVVWPAWFPFCVFLPFLADASVTLLRRLCNGERFWEAHREHYYQRMIQMRGVHRAVVLRWYAVMLGGTILALCSLALPLPGRVAALIIWCLCIVLIGRTIDRRWRQYLAGASS